ncbi:MAG: hypothetical protein AAF434_01480 [Pseudomonadota bacterium]
MKIVYQEASCNEIGNYTNKDGIPRLTDDDLKARVAAILLSNLGIIDENRGYLFESKAMVSSPDNVLPALRVAEVAEPCPGWFGVRSEDCIMISLGIFSYDVTQDRRIPSPEYRIQFSSKHFTSQLFRYSNKGTVTYMPDISLGKFANWIHVLEANNYADNWREFPQKAYSLMM